MAAKNHNADARYTCCHCGKDLPVSSYYKSNSDLFAGIGHVPTCKSCMVDVFKHYYESFGDAPRAMQRVCMVYDLYFSDILTEKAFDGDPNSTVGRYIRLLNLGQYKGETFDTSIDEGLKYLTQKTQAAHRKFVAAQTAEVPEELTSKWGEGLASADYGILEEHYFNLKSSNPNCDSNQEIFIMDLCYTKMLQLRALRDSRIDDFNKLTESYRKTFTQAGLKTKQDNSANNEDCWGMWMERISQYTPEEYYKNKKLYKDFDGIGDYMERFVLRPLKNLMHGTRERDYEYKVTDEDEFSDVYNDSE